GDSCRNRIRSPSWSSRRRDTQLRTAPLLTVHSRSRSSAGPPSSRSTCTTGGNRNGHRVASAIRRKTARGGAATIAVCVVATERAFGTEPGLSLLSSSLATRSPAGTATVHAGARTELEPASDQGIPVRRTGPARPEAPGRSRDGPASTARKGRLPARRQRVSIAGPPHQYDSTPTVRRSEERNEYGAEQSSTARRQRV